MSCESDPIVVAKASAVELACLMDVRICSSLMPRKSFAMPHIDCARVNSAEI
jgi:hypothetical protein